MRYALLSDVHGNAHALDAVLAFAAGQAIDAYVCAGDLVGYGPAPDACVERVLALPGIRCVAGNHDLIALERLGDDRCIPAARHSLAWTRRTMAARTQEALAALPPDLELDEGAVVVAHGGLGDPQRYVETARAADAELAGLLQARPAARVLVVGHTHRALAVARGGRVLLGDATGTIALTGVGAGAGPVLVNPGAVGQSRERGVRARMAVLDTVAGEVTFHALDYDVAAARAALASAGLSPEGVHLPPRPPWRRAATRARRRAGRLVRRVRRDR